MIKLLSDRKWRICASNYLKYVKNSERSVSSSVDFVDNADVVIIGGGIAGCNTLYQLSKRGVSAVLLEKSKLTSGTTWHTAGLVWSLRPSDLEVQLLADSRSVYDSLEAECGDYAGWINNGGMFISRSKIRTQEYLRLHTLGKAFGIESTMMDSQEAHKMVPILDPSVFQTALFSPADGTIDPAMVCAALVKVSKQNGAKVFEEVSVHDISYEHNPQGKKDVTGVHTSKGYIKTKCVVNCGGVWGGRIARFADIPSLPLIPFKHAYVVCDALPEVRGIPNIRDHDVNLYLKVQGETVSIGGYEPNPYMLEQVPENFSFGLYDLDWNVFGVHVNSAASLCPKLGKVGIKSTVCGPESFTPDHKPILGEDPNVFGLYHNCGYNSAGMMFSAGTAVQMAEWIINGRPSLNMFTFDIRRFTPWQMKSGYWARESSHEAYVRNYNLVFPYDEPLAGRDVTHDVLIQEQVDDGAVMQSRAGWERPGFFLEGQKIRVPQYDWGGTNEYPRNTDLRYEEILAGDHTYGFSKYHNVIGEEALACRNKAGLFNMSYFGKLYLSGPDAQRAAELAFTADLSNHDGRVVYTCVLNKKGGVEADAIVSILGEGSGPLHKPIFKGKCYYIVTSGFAAIHLMAHLRSIVHEHKLRACITDVSKQMCILAVQGPSSQRILQRFTNEDLSIDAFPVFTHRIISLSSHTEVAPDITCRALRIGWSGEQGWELNLPASYATSLYKGLSRAKGIKNGGWRALTSLSAEKGFNLWNTDLRPDDNPVEANIDTFTCREHGEYIGNETVTRARKDGVTKRYAYFTLETKKALLGYEAIYRNGVVAGYLRRGDYAYYLDKPIGTGYIKHHNKGEVVTDQYLKEGEYEIEVMGEKFKATFHPSSPFDPDNQRIMRNYGSLDENTQQPHSGQNEKANWNDASV